MIIKKCEYIENCNDKIMSKCDNYIQKLDCFGEWLGCMGIIKKDKTKDKVCDDNKKIRRTRE